MTDEEMVCCYCRRRDGEIITRWDGTTYKFTSGTIKECTWIEPRFVDSTGQRSGDATTPVAFRGYICDDCVVLHYAVQAA